MDISHLKEFVTLASHMKLSSAARALFMSPSTLSQHISGLEREVGADLFSRSNGFELTAKGEAVLEHAQKILFEYNGILKDCSADAGETVRLSMPNYNIRQAPVAAARPAFLEKHPGARIIISSNEHQGDDPVDIVNEGSSDVGVLFLVRGGGQSIGELVPPDFSYARIGAYRLVFISTFNHPLADKETLTADDLDGASVTLRLCPVTAYLMDGATKVLEDYGVSVRVLYRPMSRNHDAFLTDLGLTYMTWFEPVEGSLGTPLPEYPVHRFEHELIADAYALWRPDLLDRLQVEYLDTLATIYEQW